MNDEQHDERGRPRDAAARKGAGELAILARPREPRLALRACKRSDPASPPAEAAAAGLALAARRGPTSGAGATMSQSLPTHLRGAMALAGARVLACLVLAVVACAAPATAADPLAQSCPCTGPAVGGVWRDHGQYVSCVTQAAREQARTTDLSALDARRMIRERASSTCGQSRALEGNVRVCAANPVLPCPTVRTARVDDCAECSAALAGKLVRCARVARASGGTQDVCGAAATGRILSGRVLDQRTGVDCASCAAKLGTPKAPGLDCLVAACGSGVGF
jgi:hypothetical protein